MIIGLFNTLWLFPLLLKEEEIGLIRTLINASVFLSGIATLGSTQIAVRYFPYFKDKPNFHNGFLSFILLISIIGFIIVFLILNLGGNYLINIYTNSAPLLVQNLFYLPILTFSILLFSIFGTYTLVNQESVANNFLQEFLLRALMMLGLGLILINYFSFKDYITFVSLSYFFILLLLILYIYYKKFLFLTSPKNIFKSNKLKEVLTFGGFLIVANASGSLMINIDGLMLSAFEGLRSTGIYTIAFFIATIIEIPKRALSQAVIPFVSTANKENDINKLKSLYKSSSANQLIIGTLIFLLIWINVDNIFSLIPNGEIYKEGKWVVFFIGLGKLFDLATGINSEIIGTSKYYKFDILFSLGLAVVGIYTNYLLIPIYGITGAAIATAFSVFLINTFRFLFIYKVFKMQPFSKNIFCVLLLGFIPIYFGNSIPAIGNSVLDIILKSFLVLILFLLPVYFLNISTELNNIATKVFKIIKK